MVKIKIKNENYFKEIIKKIGGFKEVNGELNRDGILMKFSEDKIISIEGDKSVIYPLLSVYLLFEKINDTYKEKKLVLNIFNKRVSTAYDLTLINLEIEKIFLFNEILDIDSFLKFNMNGLIEDINTNNVSKDFELKQVKDELQETFKQYDLFKEVFIEIKENEIYINSKISDYKITIDNFKDVTGLNVSFDTGESDFFVRNIVFCKIIAYLLEIENIYISKEYFDFYRILDEVISYEGLDVKLITF